MNEGCQAAKICLENGTFIDEPAPPCHELAACQVKDGSRGCHCIDGYRGDGIENCDSMSLL